MRNMYYGANPGPENDFLVHYGVKGMKWGVRKALRNGNSKSYTKQYQKALRKLERLNAKANIQQQKQAAEKHNKRAKIAAGIGVAGAGTIIGNNVVARKILKAAGASVGNYTGPRRKKIVGEGKGITIQGEGLQSGPVGNTTSGTRYAQGSTVANTGASSAAVGSKSSSVNGYKVIRNVGAGLAAGGLATAAYQKGKAIAAKRRTTKKGHAKAVAKRDAWKWKMARTFQETSRTQKKKRR